jgi:tRNA dimethylallyltransferase
MAPHHLLDVADPDEDFTAADFVRLARPLIADLAARGRLPMVVGGTGLYIRSLLRGLFDGPPRDEAYRAFLRSAAGPEGLHGLLSELDPEAAAAIGPTERHRLERALEVLYLTGESIVAHQRRHALSERPYESLTVIVDRPLPEMEIRLAERTRAMYEGGLVEEARGLLEKGYDPSLKPLGAVGYREAVGVALGRLGLAEAEAETLLRTRRLAKRQRTWFRGQAPDGVWTAPEGAARLVRQFLAAP